MNSILLHLWYALLMAAFPPVKVDTAPRVEYVEADGWHYVVRKQNSYFVIQSGTPHRFKIGDRLKTLQERAGEQRVLVNDTPRITSVWVNSFRLDYNQARIQSAEFAMQLVARTE